MFQSTTLGERVVSYKIWKPGGLIVEASDKALVGERFPESAELRAAWGGRVSGEIADPGDDENRAETELGIPLLEIYSPIREVWSGRIIGACCSRTRCAAPRSLWGPMGSVARCSFRSRCRWVC